MLPRVRIGVVGVGKMGSLHLEKLLNEPSVEVVGIFDADPEQSNVLTHKYRIKSFPSTTELFFEAEAVFIASPTISHYIVAKQALESGLHVFVEKPICETGALARELVRLAHARNLILQVGFVERYRIFKALKELHLGKLQYIEVSRFSSAPSRERGMDVVMDLMIHDIDMVLWLLREHPAWISAVGLQAGVSEVDIANARLEFPGGAVANLNASWVSPERHRKVKLFAEKAIVEFDLLSNTLEVLSREEGSSGLTKREVALPAIDALQEQCGSFVRAIQQSSAPLVSGEDGLRALEVALSIRERMRERHRSREFTFDSPKLVPSEWRAGGP